MIFHGGVETGRDTKNYSGESVGMNLRLILCYIINPQVSQNITVLFINRYHEECLLHVCYHSDLTRSESDKEIQDELLELWAFVKALVQ